MANTLKFKTAQELRDKLNGFDTWLEAMGYKYRTLERLCEYLDCCRQTLLNYVNGLESTVDEGEIDNIGQEITRVKRRLLADCVDRLYDRDTVKGAEFQLKNNYGYSDRQAVDLSATAEIKYTGGNADFDLGQ